MIVYIYSKCSTCKNALHFLEEKRIGIEIKEITTTPPSLEELKAMLGVYKGNLKKLFNTSGNLYREMQLSDQLNHMPVQKALELLSSHGMLVKRPFLLGKNFGLLGFNKTEWQNILTGSYF